MSNPEPSLVDRPTARRLLGDIGTTTLHKLINEGKLRRVKLGAKTLITVESIRALAESLEG
ncbi:helix-turn-helix transcriptional regulator [Azospirillum argentinense]|uniref:DNA-binding protein n=2 Tax=Azospirillum TaxID=191 RepID=A0A235HJ31_AZOBR|nr:hypothetical protein CHT98_02935 [Azospirillum brasilense]